MSLPDIVTPYERAMFDQWTQKPPEERMAIFATHGNLDVLESMIFRGETGNLTREQILDLINTAFAYRSYESISNGIPVDGHQLTQIVGRINDFFVSQQPPQQT